MTVDGGDTVGEKPSGRPSLSERLRRPQRSRTAARPGSSLRDRLQGVDNLLAVVASVLLPLGFVVILLGWFGASRTPNLFEQIPYLISGGLLGLAMVTGAGLLYFGSWVAAAAREQRTASQEQLEVLQAIRRELQQRPAELPVQNGRGRRSTSNGTASASRPSATDLVATASGSMLHRPDCTVVVDRTDLHAVDPATTSLRPCRLCDPLRPSAQSTHR